MATEMGRMPFFYNQEGRLVQVDYALQAVSRGSTTLGLKTKDFALLSSQVSHAAAHGARGEGLRRRRPHRGHGERLHRRRDHPPRPRCGSPPSVTARLRRAGSMSGPSPGTCRNTCMSSRCNAGPALRRVRPPGRPSTTWASSWSKWTRAGRRSRVRLRDRAVCRRSAGDDREGLPSGNLRRRGDRPGDPGDRGRERWEVRHRAWHRHGKLEAIRASPKHGRVTPDPLPFSNRDRPPSAAAPWTALHDAVAQSLLEEGHRCA